MNFFSKVFSIIYKSINKELIFIYFLFINFNLFSQSKKTIIKEYKNGKINIENYINLNNRIEVYNKIEYLTNLIWGKVERIFLIKYKCKILDSTYFINFYDYDMDSIPDQFELMSLEYKALNQDFGFLYDLNKDGNVDYIVYNGGFSNCIGEFGMDFYYYYYHFIDSNFDGAIDMLTYNTIVPQGFSAPDRNIVLWVIDKDYNNRPDSVDFINNKNFIINSLKDNDGIWEFNTLFGVKNLKAESDSTFYLANEYLKAINK